jgi:hypothetical protein
MDGYGQKAGGANAATCAQNSGKADRWREWPGVFSRDQPPRRAQNGRNRVENCIPIFSNRRLPLGGTALSEGLEADDRTT